MFRLVLALPEMMESAREEDWVSKAASPSPTHLPYSERVQEAPLRPRPLLERFLTPSDVFNMMRKKKARGPSETRLGLSESMENPFTPAFGTTLQEAKLPTSRPVAPSA